jgi:hypothetical protein
MIAIAAILTFVLTTVMAMAGVGAAFVLIPVYLALGIELHTAMATALLLNAVAMSVASVTFVRKRLVVWRLVILAAARDHAPVSPKSHCCVWGGRAAACHASLRRASAAWRRVVWRRQLVRRER